MIYRQVFLESMGYELPPLRVSSAELENRLAPAYERLRLPAGRLELMTGIKERRFWEPGMRPSQGAILAGKKALANSKIPPERIGCLINCSVSRDFLEPATATVVHAGLGLAEDALVFDLSNACLGILSGMVVVANLIETGRIQAGMLVAGENGRSLVENTVSAINGDLRLTRQTVKPYFASLTIGSGAVALIMGGSQFGGHRLTAEATVAATEYNHLCRGSADQGMEDGAATMMNTDSEALLHSGVDTAFRTWRKFLAESGLTAESLDCICTHQVGSAHKRLLFERLGLDPRKDYSNLESMGNVGSVSCPMAMMMAADAGRLTSGSRLALLGIGSGINCTMLGVEW